MEHIHYVPQLPAELWEEIKPIFRQRFPCETAVAITNGKWREVPNVSTTPAAAWTASPADTVWLFNNPPDLLIHSHPLPWGPPHPSDMDLQMQAKTGWNMGVVPVSGNEFGDVYDVAYPACWGKDIPIRPLLGRSYLFGITDCVSICWDWYQLNGYNVPRASYVRYPLNYAEGSKERNQFEELPLKVGMKPVERHNRQRGDLCIMRFNDGPVDNHCAIYLGEATYLHQPDNRLSYEWTIHKEDKLIEQHNFRFYRPKGKPLTS